MADRNVDHDYIIWLYGATPEERDILDYSILREGIGNKGQLTLWEVDALTAKYPSQKKFLEDVHQFLMFEPKGIKVVTNDPICRPIIFNDYNIAYLAEAMIKKNPANLSEASIDEVSKDNNSNYGHDLIEKLIENYRNALTNPGMLKIMVALYKSGITDYHLSFLLNYFEVLANALNYHQDFIGAGRKDVFEATIKQYNSFREAYIFYKRAEFDYKTIMNFTNYGDIKTARVVVDDAATGYKYELTFNDRPPETISSRNRLLNEKIKDELVFNNKVEDEKEERNWVSIGDAKRKEELTTLTNAMAVLNEKKRESEANIIKFEPSKPIIDDELEGEGITKKLVSDHNMFKHEDYLDSYDIGDEKEDKEQSMTRAQADAYIRYLDEKDRGKIAARRNKPNKW